MAFSVKISFVPGDSGKECYSFDLVDYGLIPIGGDIQCIKDNFYNNFKTLNFREIYADGYYDFVSVLTMDEFMYFHNAHQKDGDRQVNEFILHGMQKIKYSWVIIVIYEWESGLN
jgi:hypothetical protein